MAVVDLRTYLQNHDKKHGAIPDIKDLSKTIGKSEEITKQILDSLKKQGFLGYHDGKYYVKTVSSKFNKIENKDSIENKNSHTIKKFIIDFLTKEHTHISIKLIKWVMFIISLACIIVSIHLSYKWLNNYFDWFYCLIFASSSVSYASFAPQASVILFNKGKKILPFILMLTSIICLMFSMFCSVAGQYKTNNIKVVSNLESKQTSNIDLYNTEKELKIHSVSQNNKQIDINQKRIDYLSNKKEEKTQKELNEYYTLLSNNTYLKNQRDEYLKELETIINKLKEMYSTNNDVVVEKKLNFYEFIESVFTNVKADQIEMWGYLFFAIMLDILAPLGLAVFFCDFKDKRIEKKDSIFNKIFKPSIKN